MHSISSRFDEIKIIALLISTLYAVCSLAGETVSQAVNLQCEHLTNPLGVERKQPRLSWQMKAVKGVKSQLVTAYRVLVASRPDVLAGDRGDLWDSGKRVGLQPINIAYAGVPLQSLQSCYWKVKIWDEKKRELVWSEPAHWFMGVLDERDWRGDWIGYAAESGQDPFSKESFDAARWIWYGADDPNKPPAEIRYFHKMIDIGNLQELQWAEMICTANDAFQLAVNGHLLTPAKMVFDAADSIPRFNLAPFLHTGQNEIAITAEKFVPAFTHVSIKPVAGVIGVIKIKRVGRDIETMVTDADWQARKTVDEPWQAARDLASAGSHWRHMPGWRQVHSSPLFRKSFAAIQVRDAKIAISGLGYYELYCNGQRVGDHVLDPLFTNYDHRVSYVCYDVTELINRGDNVLAVMLGNGWYNMHTRATWNFDKAPWRDEPKLRALLQLTLSDGTTQQVVSDASWRANTGPIVLDGIHNGEVYDARLERAGWSTAAFQDSSWPHARVVAAPKGRLTSQVMPAMKVTETVVPVRITEPDSGIFVADLGRNMAGWARIKVHGSAGTRIRLRFSERLDSNGRINEVSNSRYMFQGPFQTDTYILKGEGVEIWEPRFTHHGFRYVEVTGWPGKPTTSQINGRVVHTAFDRTGHFICSDSLLNKIAIMTDRSYRSNFVGYPTDCPQREKNGWTGDAHLAMEQAMYNYSNISAYESWCRELADSRTPDGDLPGIVPTGGWGYHPDNGPGWGSAAVIIPWYLYLYTGDLQVLSDHYHLMKGYVDFLHNKFPDHIVEMCRGDWVYLHTKTPPRVTSTALYYYDTHLLATTAALINKPEEAAEYQKLAEAVRSAYHKRFYLGDGRYDLAGQTAQAMTLYYDLAPESEKRATAGALAEAVHQAKDHIDCGFLGMKSLFQALSENGYHSLAYTVATQRDFPGYGDWIARGATTLWEDWTDTEGSLNHDALGDIVTWFYRSLAGINADPEQPGFRHIIIRPRPVNGLTFVRAEIESTFGPISSEWTLTQGKFKLAITIPPNSSASVIMPDGRTHKVVSGNYLFSCSNE
jgi:alpha-L-rhamnosidase